MGVIDLNARVRALEENAGNSQEIDQIEADLTALEETVDGLIEDVSDKLTLNPNLTFADGYPVVIITKIGDYCFCQILGSVSSGASAAGVDYPVGTLDEAIRPSTAVSAFTIGELTSARSSFIGTDGVVKTQGGNWFSFEAFWKIATPTTP